MSNITRTCRTAGLPACLATALMVCAFAVGCRTIPKQQAYGSPEAAVGALIAAVRTNDTGTLSLILGPGADEVLSSGDETDDVVGHAKFLALYDEKHGLVKDGENKVEIVVGKAEWPFPIPAVKGREGWVFDTKAGMDEVLDRRVGRNELQTIQALLAIVDAQREYAMKDRDGDGIIEYASKFRSTPGSKDGLYWEAAGGGEPSPLGLMAAQAQKEHYVAKMPEEGLQPYHGYIFRILAKQGPHARGGAFDYMVNGNMIGGFAVVASPAQYGNSGVMTFMVNYNGIVYQKDLGEDTEEIAARMDSFDPDETWRKARQTIE